MRCTVCQGTGIECGCGEGYCIHCDGTGVRTDAPYMTQLAPEFGDGSLVDIGFPDHRTSGEWDFFAAFWNIMRLVDPNHQPAAHEQRAWCRSWTTNSGRKSRPQPARHL